MRRWLQLTTPPPALPLPHRRPKPPHWRRCVVHCSQRPPDGYSHREQLLEPTLAVVQARYPELEDLVLKGDLVMVPRPASYLERREDGYQEPLEVFLLGTAHLSARSAADVRRVVAAVQPDSVVVELCRSRSALMYAGELSPSVSHQQQQQQQQLEGSTDTSGSDSEGAAGSEGAGGASGLFRSSRRAASAAAPGLLSLSGPGLLPAFQRSLELGGRGALLLRLLLSALASRVSVAAPGGSGGGSSSGGGAPGLGPSQAGEEFRVARVAAEACGAQIVLGDRPIEITLERAWQALSWQRRLQLAARLARGAASQGPVVLDEEAVEQLKSDDTVSLLFSQLAAEFPEVMDPLIHERDRYLAWSLKRSKAVNGNARVVGVVGKGHLRGVCYALSGDSSQLRFKDLVGRKNERRRRAAEACRQLARQVAVDTAVAGALFYAWTLWGPS